MVKKHNNSKKVSQNIIAAIGAVIVLIGGFFLSYNYVQAKKIIAYDYMANAFYDGTNVKIKEDKDKQEQEQKEVEEVKQEEVTNEYIGYLNIPKINLTKGFLDVRSTENDVEKNIIVVEGSDYPDTKKGNLILAGHSGTGWKAFFNDLYKLNKGDVAYINYKGNKYIYQIVNIYKQPKTGSIAIYRDYEKTTLTLITCTNWDSTSQTVYIAELVNVEKE